MTAPTRPLDDLRPWYERGPDGIWTGRDWATEDQARAQAAPGCTVHLDLRVAHPGDSWTFGHTEHTQPAPSVVARHGRKPRGF